MIVSNQSNNNCRKSRTNLYANFIRTFTFSPAPTLPIVQPGENVPFPIPVVPSRKLRYDEKNNVLSIPRGTYLVYWILNPSQNASVSLLINGDQPLAQNGFPYTTQQSTEPMYPEYLVVAPRRRNTLSIVNTGPALLTLNDIPNTRIGDTSVITEVYIQRISRSSRQF